MSNDQLDCLTRQIEKLSPQDQDYLAGFLLMQRLRRNKLIMPSIHQRIEDADPENWQDFHKLKTENND